MLLLPDVLLIKFNSCPYFHNRSAVEVNPQELGRAGRRPFNVPCTEMTFRRLPHSTSMCHLIGELICFSHPHVYPLNGSRHPNSCLCLDKGTSALWSKLEDGDLLSQLWLLMLSVVVSVNNGHFSGIKMASAFYLSMCFNDASRISPPVILRRIYGRLSMPMQVQVVFPEISLAIAQTSILCSSLIQSDSDGGL